MPTTVYPIGRPTDVLVVCGTWRLRTPLRAQLIEDGYDVTAVGSWDEAELLLRTRAVRPCLVVLDLLEEPHPSAVVTSLGPLVPNVPVLVLTSESVLPAGETRRLGLRHVMARPFRVRDVEAKIAELLKGR